MTCPMRNVSVWSQEALCTDTGFFLCLVYVCVRACVCACVRGGGVVCETLN